MADLNSWEDDKDAQDENLAQQAQQQMNINAARVNAFQPGASAFTPGASSFTPGQPFQQYGGGYNQYGQYYGGGFPQYGGQQQQQYGQYGYGQQQQGYGGYPQQQQAYGGYPQQNFQQQQQQPRQTPKIAKRGDDLQAAAPAKPADAPADAPKAPKTLSIGGDGSTKVESAGGTKVLSIGGDAPKVEKAGATKVLSIGGAAPSSAAKDAANKDKGAPEAGKKVTAAKAIEKTGEAAGPAASGKTSPTPSSGRASPTRAADVRAAKQQADMIAQEQAADVDEDTLAEMYGKEHVNVIFLGHVDAGKSTLGGSILYATGMVDERTMDKYKREAKEAGRETWYLSWALDLTKEERSKGKTVEVGRGFFETEVRRYSILDAPGHKTYVPNMIGGASQADVGVLVISARKGEYETGFEKGGQTREHAVLAKTQGVNKLVVVVNKMDDPTVEWSEDRYKECTTKLAQFLKGVGYNPKTGRCLLTPVAVQHTNNRMQMSCSCPSPLRPRLVSRTVYPRTSARGTRAPRSSSTWTT